MSDRVTSMQTFVSAVDRGSLSGAARALGKSLAAVSRTVTQLEERLGVRLLHRSTRKLALTEAGAAFYESAKRILAEIDEAELSLGGGVAAPRGTLTVTAPLLFGRLHVAPIVADCLARYPEVAAQLILTDRNVNLVEEGIDVAVRIGHLDDSALVARRLGEIPRIVCAAPAYLRRHGEPSTPDDLRTRTCIRFTGLTPGREWTFVHDGKEFRVPVAGRFACNVAEPAIDLARAGGGILMVLGYQVADDLAAGRLVRVLQPFEPAPEPVSALFLSPRLMAARVRAFLDLVTQEIPRRLDQSDGTRDRRQARAGRSA